MTENEYYSLEILSEIISAEKLRRKYFGQLLEISAEKFQLIILIDLSILSRLLSILVGNILGEKTFGVIFKCFGGHFARNFFL